MSWRVSSSSAWSAMRCSSSAKWASASAFLAAFISRMADAPWAIKVPTALAVFETALPRSRLVAGACEVVGCAALAAFASAVCGAAILPVPPSITEKPAACGSTASAPIVGCSSCRNEGMVLPWSATGVSPGTNVEAASL